jgi:hypothetical protein
VDISGISKLPELLKYPKLLAFDNKLIQNKYCYIIEHYGYQGISILITFDKDSKTFVVRGGSWDGKIFDINSNKHDSYIFKLFMEHDIHKFMSLMKLMAFKQAQYYFAISDKGLFLVDVQLSLNKFASPGMIKDIFGKIYPTQNVLKIEIINDKVLDAMERGIGSYENNLILKPSAFSVHHLPDGQGLVPFYTEIKR